MQYQRVGLVWGTNPILRLLKTKETHWLSVSFNLYSSGKTGIRTLGTRKGTTVFETVPIDHSGIFPVDLRVQN